MEVHGHINSPVALEKRSPWYQLNKWTPESVWMLWRNETLLLLSGIEPLFLGPLAHNLTALPTDVTCLSARNYMPILF
jgi:hypothetical protein